MTTQQVVSLLKLRASPKNVKGMARFGITTKIKVLGVDNPGLKEICKEIKTKIVSKEERHGLAINLWKTKIYDARILASWIDSPELVTEKQMDDWVKDFDNWAICDSTIGHLLDRTKFSERKIFEYIKNEKEFIRRAGFVIMTWMSVHNKEKNDKYFINFFPYIKKYSIDERNFVKKAVNWVLRQIGKRNANLNKKAIKLAQEIQKIDSKSAKWIANNALSELTKIKKFHYYKNNWKKLV